MIAARATAFLGLRALITRLGGASEEDVEGAVEVAMWEGPALGEGALVIAGGGIKIGSARANSANGFMGASADDAIGVSGISANICWTRHARLSS